MCAVERRRIVDGLRDCLMPRPEILQAYLFGSRARGADQHHSDIDVAVYVDPDRLPDSVFG